MSSSCRKTGTYSISICEGGHATVQLGRTAIFLEVEELKSLLATAQEVLNEYKELHQPKLMQFSSHVRH